MRIRKFSAPTIEDAIRKVRAELGADAVPVKVANSSQALMALSVVDP